MTVTKEQAMTKRDFEHTTLRDSQGNWVRCRATGKCQTWKTRPEDFKLPVKYGLRDSFYITNENAKEWRVAGTWVCHRCGGESQRDDKNCHTCGEPRQEVSVFKCATGWGWLVQVGPMADLDIPYSKTEKKALEAARAKYPHANITTKE
jgi:hypothetical protein